MVKDETNPEGHDHEKLEPENLISTLAKLKGCCVDRYSKVLDEEQEKLRCGLLAGLDESQAALLGGSTEYSRKLLLPPLQKGVNVDVKQNRRHKQRLFVHSLEQTDNSDAGDSTDGSEFAITEVYAFALHELSQPLAGISVPSHVDSTMAPIGLKPSDESEVSLGVLDSVGQNGNSTPVVFKGAQNDDVHCRNTINNCEYAANQLERGQNNSSDNLPCEVLADEGVRIVNLRDLKEVNFSSLDRDDALGDNIDTSGIGDVNASGLAFEAKDLCDKQPPKDKLANDVCDISTQHSLRNGEQKDQSFQPTCIEEGASKARIDVSDGRILQSGGPDNDPFEIRDKALLIKESGEQSDLTSMASTGRASVVPGKSDALHPIPKLDRSNFDLLSPSGTHSPSRWIRVDGDVDKDVLQRAANCGSLSVETSGSPHVYEDSLRPSSHKSNTVDIDHSFMTCGQSANARSGLNAVVANYDTGEGSNEIQQDENHKQESSYNLSATHALQKTSAATHGLQAIGQELHIDGRDVTSFASHSVAFRDVANTCEGDSMETRHGVDTSGWDDRLGETIVVDSDVSGDHINSVECLRGISEDGLLDIDDLGVGHQHEGPVRSSQVGFNGTVMKDRTSSGLYDWHETGRFAVNDLSLGIAPRAQFDVDPLQATASEICRGEVDVSQTSRAALVLVKKEVATHDGCINDGVVGQTNDITRNTNYLQRIVGSSQIPEQGSQTLQAEETSSMQSGAYGLASRDDIVHNDFESSPVDYAPDMKDVSYGMVSHRTLVHHVANDSGNRENLEFITNRDRSTFDISQTNHEDTVSVASHHLRETVSGGGLSTRTYSHNASGMNVGSLEIGKYGDVIAELPFGHHANDMPTACHDLELVAESDRLDMHDSERTAVGIRGGRSHGMAYSGQLGSAEFAQTDSDFATISHRIASSNQFIGDLDATFRNTAPTGFDILGGTHKPEVLESNCEKHIPYAGDSFKGSFTSGQPLTYSSGSTFANVDSTRSVEVDGIPTCDQLCVDESEVGQAHHSLVVDDDDDVYDTFDQFVGDHGARLTCANSRTRDKLRDTATFGDVFADGFEAHCVNGALGTKDNLCETAAFGNVVGDGFEAHRVKYVASTNDTLRGTASFGMFVGGTGDVVGVGPFPAVTDALRGTSDGRGHTSTDSQAWVTRSCDFESSEPNSQHAGRKASLRIDDTFGCVIPEVRNSTGSFADACLDNRGFMRGLMQQMREYNGSSCKMSRCHSIGAAEGIHERVINQPGASIPSVGYSSRAGTKGSLDQSDNGCLDALLHTNRRQSPKLSDSNSNSRGCSRRRARSSADGLLDRARARMPSPLRNCFGQQPLALGILPSAKAEGQIAAIPKEISPALEAKGVGKGNPGKPPPKKAGPPKGPPPPKKGGAKAAAKAVEENLRKPDVKPACSLKKLYWSSFRLKDSEGNTIWDEIDNEGADIDVTELEQQFKDEIGGKASPAPFVEKTRKIRKIQVLDQQRRQQICVMLARLPDNETLNLALMAMDKSKLNKDQIELLLRNLPSLDELKLIKNAQATQIIDESNVWDLAEEFVVFLIRIPQFQLRLQVWDFENSFSERLNTMSSSAGDLERACDVVLESKSIKRLMGIVLATGNYLNGGTPRGRADGFAIDTLNQMRTVRMSQALGDNRPGSLIDYIARQMEKQSPDEIEQMLASDKEMGRIKSAARYNLTELIQELVSVKNKAEQMLTKMKLAKVTEEQQVQPDAFGEHAETLSECIVHLTEQHDRLISVQGKYAQLCKWFHMEDGPAKKSTDEFFTIWDKFLADIIQARKSLKDQEKQEAIKRARSEITASRGLTPQGRRRTLGAMDDGREKKTRSATPRRSSVQSVFSRLQRRNSDPSVERVNDIADKNPNSTSASPEGVAFSRPRLARAQTTTTM